MRTSHPFGAPAPGPWHDSRRPLAAATSDRDGPPPARRPGRALVAGFGRLPPTWCGVGDTLIRLVRATRHALDWELFYDPEPQRGHSPQATPTLPDDLADVPCRPWSQFEAWSAHYDHCLYNLGNSALHRHSERALAVRPGVVVLHDLDLAGLAGFRGTGEDPGALLGWYLERATAVVVYSDRARRELVARHSRHAGKVRAIPMGADLIAPGPDPLRRAAIRRSLGIDPAAFVVGMLGSLHGNKMVVEALDAFAALARTRPDALLLLAGPEHDGGEARRVARGLLSGLASRVVFAGEAPSGDVLALWGSCCDLGISLRRPPSSWETSASLLDLLRAGVPTIATDVGTFADVPDPAVRRWHHDSGPAALAAALVDLACDEAERRRLSAAALGHVAAVHSWPGVARAYLDLLSAPPPARTAQSLNIVINITIRT